MKVFLVGGAVRDGLLGLPVRERDWVVVGATAAQMLEAGYIQVPADFPVYRHPGTGEEYALARVETKTGPGHRGFEVDAGPHISLVQDLRRRDLTINAMAEDQEGRLIDPFQGRADLDAGLLRHVSPAFEEDPLRVLRVARFSARLGRWGFRVAHATHQLMRRMAAGEDFLTLAAERVWQEMEQALAAEQPWRFVEVLHRCGALGPLVPELAQRLGAPAAHQDRPDPAPLAALKRAAMLSADPRVRFAALMHDAAAGDPRALCRRLRAGRQCCDLLGLTVLRGPQVRAMGTAGPAEAVNLLEATRALQSPDTWVRLLRTAAALWPEAVAPIQGRLEQARLAAAAARVGDLRESGLRGAELGRALTRRRIEAVRAAWQVVERGVE